jgi:hypothetical protein
MPLRTYVRAGCALLLAFAAACSDRENPLGPELPEPGPSEMAQLQCTAVVADATVTCVPVQPGGARADRLVGGQDVYVKLASSGTAYDGTINFTSNVTVQNLTQNVVGTDGVNTLGVRVFFASGPTRVGGTGNVSVVPDGFGTFTEAGQAYYLYSQVLDPYEISTAKQWLFQVDNTVTTFVFTVYVALTMPDENADLLGAVWDGSASTDWQDGANWSTSGVPTSTSVVSIPADSLLASSNLPVLTDSAEALHVRVGYQSTLGLGGHLLAVGGNVDAVGAISNGTLVMSGTGALLKGTVDVLNVTGSTSLQGAAKATGAVSVTGSLYLNGNALTISVP